MKVKLVWNLLIVGAIKTIYMVTLDVSVCGFLSRANVQFTNKAHKSATAEYVSAL